MTSSDDRGREGCRCSEREEERGGGRLGPGFSCARSLERSAQLSSKAPGRDEGLRESMREVEEEEEWKEEQGKKEGKYRRTTTEEGKIGRASCRERV